MMRRRDDWPERLASLIETRRATPFVWGASDCCVFVADAIAAMTDVDVLVRWRGKYRDERGALRILRAHGGMLGFTNTMLSAAGPTAAALAGRGDVVAVSTPIGDGLALHIGNAIVGQGSQGLEFLPLSSIKNAWKI